VREKVPKADEGQWSVSQDFPHPRLRRGLSRKAGEAKINASSALY